MRLTDAFPAPLKGNLKLVLWTALLGLVFGFIGFGEVLEDGLRVARNHTHRSPASGQIVAIRIDDKALRQVANWPWPRERQADLIDKLDAAGASRIFYDINFSFPSTAKADRELADAMARSGKVTILGRAKTGRSDASVGDGSPLEMFAQHAGVASASVKYNYANAVWTLPYSDRVGAQPVPTMAAAMAGVIRPPGQNFRVDYSIDAASIPFVSAADVIAGRLKPNALAGKTVLIGVDSNAIGDRYFIPGLGRAAGMYVHAIGAETLLAGPQTTLGWFPAFMFAMAAALAWLAVRSPALRGAIFIGASGTLLLVPALLEARRIFVDITPALFVLWTICGLKSLASYRSRALVNPGSNLPNLTALAAHKPGRKMAIIAARISNYEAVLESLPESDERQLAEQVAARLNPGNKDVAVYQGDGGIFAWFCAPGTNLANHLDALHALFRAPAKAGKQSVDLSVTFGVEVGSGRSLHSRLASALVAAEDAARDGLKWCYHNPESLQSAAWRLSMLSQLDDAIDNGEVWVAYQPKICLKSMRIIGAEALARWNHPDKGTIPAAEFVAAAEQHDRIGKLTDFVLERSLQALAEITRRFPGFGMAVNMSAKLMTDRNFLDRFQAALDRHGIETDLVTLELTETAALASSGEGLDMIGRLRHLGVHIAIDDYGTGLSTLDYLKRVPANEIKIDQSFIKPMLDNRSDRLMVQSTIELAHSLGHRVVAEGVEQRALLALLAELGCDIAQGFTIGRPMSLDSLIRRLGAQRPSVAA